MTPVDDEDLAPMEVRARELCASGIDQLDAGNFPDAIVTLSQSLSYAGTAQTYLYRAKAFLKNRQSQDALSDTELGLSRSTAETPVSVVNELKSLQDSITKKLEDKVAPKALEKKRQRQTDMEQLLQEVGSPSLRLMFEKSKNAVNKTHVGGFPLVAADFQWPRSPDGRALAFLLQLDCAEVARFPQVRQNLPDSGLLSFFYDSVEQPWGFDPAHKGSWLVSYCPDSAELKPAAYPADLDQSRQPPAFNVRWKEEITYPDPATGELLSVTFSPDPDAENDDDDPYTQFLEHHYGSDPINRLFGRPQLIQSDWRTECQLASYGESGDSADYDDSKIHELENGASNWRLLLQLDSFEKARMEWGDGGRLYFCIENDALQNRDFSRVWTILQCY